MWKASEGGGGMTAKRVLDRSKGDLSLSMDGRASLVHGEKVGDLCDSRQDETGVRFANDAIRGEPRWPATESRALHRDVLSRSRGRRRPGWPAGQRCDQTGTSSLLCVLPHNQSLREEIVISAG